MKTLRDVSGARKRGDAPPHARRVSTVARYIVPREAASDDEDLRRVHADLLALSDFDLRCEAWRVVGALAANDQLRLDEHAWLTERLQRVAEEQRRRHSDGRGPGS